MQAIKSEGGCMIKKMACCGVLMVFLGAGVCIAKDNTNDNSAPEKEFTLCPEPRPQMCTREYRPVCATLNDGTHKTYANGCTACSDPKVKGYFPDACE